MSNPSPDVQRARQASLAALVAVERAALPAISGAVSASLYQAGPTGAAADLRRRLPPVLRDVRGAARRMSSAATEQELRALARGLSASLPRPPPALLTRQDDAQAVETSNALADALLAALAKLPADEQPTPGALAVAIAPNVRRIAATEVSQAFNLERQHAARDVAGIIGGALTCLWVWDATLDKRTCPVCRRLDGSVALMGSDFDGRLPGLAHPFCRCISVMLIERALGWAGRPRLAA